MIESAILEVRQVIRATSVVTASLKSSCAKPVSPMCTLYALHKTLLFEALTLVTKTTWDDVELVSASVLKAIHDISSKDGMPSETIVGQIPNVEARNFSVS